jgi:hypothetical protein
MESHCSFKKIKKTRFKMVIVIAQFVLVPKGKAKGGKLA